MITTTRLQIKRPIVFLDLETTGVNPRYDRIIEIGAVKMLPDGSRQTYERRINPECPIPVSAVRIHGITDDDVADRPTFSQIAGELFGWLRGCDIGGFGVVRFDIPLLTTEFSRVGVAFPDPQASIVDAQVIYHKREPRTLTAALNFYCNTDHPGAHGALADAEAALEVVSGQLQKYSDLPATIPELHGICHPTDDEAIDPSGKLRWSGPEIIINFGQKKGMRIKDLASNEPNYLRWMMSKDFSAEVKTIVRDALAGRFPSRPEASTDDDLASP